MTHAARLARARVLETIESRVKQFRWRDEIKPFRVPHEPLVLDEIIEEALADAPDLKVGPARADALRSRTLMRLEWDDGHAWSAWAISLPSGITVYCDTDGVETRVLASVKRGSQIEADRFFLELLAESSGNFGIEMSGAAPDRVRTPITDREFLADIFVELFEDTPAERSIHRLVPRSGDFRAEIAQWLRRVLVAPTPSKSRRARRRIKRFREED